MTGRFSVDTRLLGAAALAAVAAALVLGLTAPAATTDVLVAAHAQPAAIRVGEMDLAVRAVLDPTGLVPADRIPDLSDHLSIVALGPGSPLIMELLSPPGDRRAPDVVGVEVPSAAAVHGSLEPGDLVDVYGVGEELHLVAAGVPVVAVFADDGALGVGDVGLLLAADGELASAIITAEALGSLHFVRQGS